MERNRTFTIYVTEEERKAVIVWQAEQTAKRGYAMTREEALRELIARGLASRPYKKKRSELALLNDQTEVGDMACFNKDGTPTPEYAAAVVSVLEGQLKATPDASPVPGLKKAVDEAAARNRAGIRNGW